MGWLRFGMVVLVVGCGGNEVDGRPVLPGTVFPDTTVDEDVALASAALMYDPDRVVVVEASLADADALALASQTRTIFPLLEGEGCLDAPWESPYTWFATDVWIDGVRVEQAGVRKKGLIGSQSTDKPGLKVDFDKFVEGRSYLGLERMTLNNSVSDPSYVRQCLGYDLFRAAGLAAPRCNFAHLTVNGLDLGVYVNVEPVKKDFLRFAYDSDEDGHLYEGTLSDFRAGWTRTFDPKTGDTDLDLGPILAVTDALALADDDAMLSALEAVLDLDQYLDFWALEVLVGHVDGYAGNTNNFYVYVPEQTGLLEFIPWGIDHIFYDSAAFGSDTSEIALVNGALPHRLWSIPAVRDRYVASLQRMLDTVWDEPHLLAEIDRMEAMVAPIDVGDADTRGQDTDQLRAFVSGRRARVESLLDGILPALDAPLRGDPCLIESGEVTVTFDTTWDTLDVADPVAEGQGTVAWSLAPPRSGGAVAGPDGSSAIVGAVTLDGTKVWTAVAVLRADQVQPGTIDIDGFKQVALLNELDLVTGEENILGSIWNGSLTFEAAGVQPGDPVRGTLTGPLYTGGPSQ